MTALLIWGWDGAILLQAFHCVFGLGTFVAPWLAAPFISVVYSNSSVLNETNLPKLENDTVTTLFPLEKATQEMIRGESHVHFSYMIVGGYSVISSGFFLLTYFLHKKEMGTKGCATQGVSAEKFSDNNQKEPKWFLYPMLVLMFLRFSFYVGLDIMSASLLMTFAVKGLGWTKPQGIAVTSCLRGVFSASRALNVFLAFVISPTKMILTDLTLILTSLLVLTIFITFNDLILWIFISMVGFGCGSFFGASMSWADKYMNVSGKIGSVFITGSWFGLLTIPAITGYLFDNVSPFCYIYACFGDSVGIAVVTLSSMALVLRYQKYLRNVRALNESFEIPGEDKDSSEFELPEDTASAKSFEIMSSATSL